MSGSKSGVVIRMCAAEPRALFTHCYGHSLNLACRDAIKHCKLMRDALDTSYEIIKLIKKSPAREAIFKKLKAEMDTDSPNAVIRVLCPTRWTVRAASFKSILDNFDVLLKVWENCMEHVKDTEMKARIQGVATQMMKFDYFIGILLGLLILRHTDNLSKAMQRADMSAAEGQDITAMTVTILKSLCNNASFDLYWKKTAAAATNLDINEPILPRRQKGPRRIDEGSSPTFHETVEDHYRVIYFEELDLISCIENCFDQPGYKTYRKAQMLLLKAAASEPYDEELQFVLSFYGSDFDSLLLPTHLEILSQTIKSRGKVTVADILEFFRSCTPSQYDLMSQVSKLVKLLLVMPATNAESERSFSAVRCIKVYLRATMSQQRLNHLMLLHVHKSRTNSLSLVDVANNFISGHDHRKNIFGTELSSSQVI